MARFYEHVWTAALCLYSSEVEQRTDVQAAGTNVPNTSLNNVNTADMNRAIMFISPTLAARQDLLYTGNVFMSATLLPAIPDIAAM
jgi:hypothetical protein